MGPVMELVQVRIDVQLVDNMTRLRLQFFALRHKALNVHEGPHSISPRFANKEPMKVGMIVSNEPGYYEDGRFGIRIENLLEVQGVEAPNKNANDKNFMRFEKLTLIPIQKVRHFLSTVQISPLFLLEF